MEKIKYLKSPKPKDKEFTYYWSIFVVDVVQRDNFKEGHLEQLRILCQLYCEFNDLSARIKEEGYTYVTETRNGTQQKISGNVSVREKITSQICQYSKLLKLVLEKDKASGPGEEVEEWD